MKKNNNKNQQATQKKTGIGAAFRNAKNNICDTMDKVTPGHGAAMAVGTVVGGGLVYGITKAAQKKAACAEYAAEEEAIVERRGR